MTEAQGTEFIVTSVRPFRIKQKDTGATYEWMDSQEQRYFYTSFHCARIGEELIGTFYMGRLFRLVWKYPYGGRSEENE